MDKKIPTDMVELGAKGLSAVVGDVYKDIAKPSARRVGLSLETLVKVALSPIDLVDWGFEQSKEWLKGKITARLAQTPSDCVVLPTTNIAHSALTHIALSNDTPALRDIYAELLLKAMDARAASSVHPAYFHLVEQLAPEEALVLVGLHEFGKEDLFSEKITLHGGSKPPTLERQFATFCATVLSRAPDHPEVWLINLCRLGLLSLQTFGEAVFQEEENDRYGYRPHSVDNHEYRMLMFTDFGRAFIGACAPPHATGAGKAAK